MCLHVVVRAKNSVGEMWVMLVKFHEVAMHGVMR